MVVPVWEINVVKPFLDNDLRKLYLTAFLSQTGVNYIIIVEQF